MDIVGKYEEKPFPRLCEIIVDELEQSQIINMRDAQLQSSFSDGVKSQTGGY
jgi:hypothetical protein